MKKTEAELLTEWFNTQKKFKTWTELAQYLDIDHRTMSHYHMGRKLVVNPDHRALLSEVTRLATFSKEKPEEAQPARPFYKSRKMTSGKTRIDGAIKPNRQQSILEGVNEEHHVREGGEAEDLAPLLVKLITKLQEFSDERQHVRLTEREATPKSSREHARRVLLLLHSLDAELQFFRHATKEERDILRQMVRGQDVGYITSLLKAMYDEDKFQSWQLFASYQMISKPGDGEAPR